MEAIESYYKILGELKRMTPDEYLKWITTTARAVCAAYDLPYACVVAQGAIESEWGRYIIGEFNIFGRKWNGSGNYIETETKEDDGAGNLYTITAKFQDYPSLAEAVRDWCELMLWGPYEVYGRQYQADHCLEPFVKGVASIYATDINYADKLLQTIRACDLAV